MKANERLTLWLNIIIAGMIGINVVFNVLNFFLK